MSESPVESELPGIEFVPSPVVEEPRERNSSSKKPGRPKGSVSQATLDKLRDDITETMVDMSAAVAPLSPLAMAVIDARAEKTANAIVILAGGSPRLIAALKKSVKAKAIVDLAMFPVAISVALMVDYQRMDPNTQIARKMGVTDLYADAYPENVVYTNGDTPAPNRSGLF